MVKKDNLGDLFGSNWDVWAPKILSFAKASGKTGTTEYIQLLSESNVSKGIATKPTILRICQFGALELLRVLYNICRVYLLWDIVEWTVFIGNILTSQPMRSIIFRDPKIF